MHYQRFPRRIPSRSAERTRRCTGARRAARALLLLLALAVPSAAHAHIRLESSSPARDEVVTTAPSHLRLLFSAHIERSYTRITLTGPGGDDIAVGDVTFVGDSDREIAVPIAALRAPGRYTVHWRTAGADGHVLEGTYAFELAPAADASAADTATAGAAVRTEPEMSQHDADAHAGHGPESVSGGGALEAVGRGLHFTALLLVLGGVALRLLLLPRLELGGAARDGVAVRAWRAVAAGAVLLALAAVLRLWLQSVALHGADRAWSSPLLSIMLRDTAWGRAWLLQAALFALLGMAIAWARPRRDRVALLVAVPAAIGLAAIPGLSGHAAGAELPARLALVNDTAHVLGAGAWLGMLAVLIVLAIPVIVRLETDGQAAAAAAVDRFSPLALAAAALVALTGVVNALLHFDAVSQLWSTEYGRTLLIKLLLVAAIGLAGFINWRWIRPRLREKDGLQRLRLSAGAELAFALLVIAATAVLTGLPRP